MPEINFFWDPLSDNILQERDETGTVTAEYTTEPGLYGNLISQNRQGEERQFHFDAIGSALALTDEGQQVVDTTAYTAFGEVTEQSGNANNPFQYVGQKGYFTDSITEEVVARVRQLVPTLGRWLSIDPIGLGDGINRFVFAGNSPINFVDPSGLLKVETRTVTNRPQCNTEVPTVVFWFTVEGAQFNSVGAPCDGYVIQKVTVTCAKKKCESCQPCSLPEKKETFSYWEAWTVKKSVKEGTIVVDNAFIPTWGGYCGDYQQVGEIRFYCRNKLQKLPNGKRSTFGVGDLEKQGWKAGRFGKEGMCPTSSIALPATDDEDKVRFWEKDKKDPIDGPAARRFTIKWDCCPEEEKDKFVTIDTDPKVTV